jgi:hypothetical protein
METRKQYVIVNAEDEYCQLLDNKLIVFTSDATKAQFFNSETIAYMFISKNATMFSEGKKTQFFTIKCVVLVWDGK